ncbi:GNAT family N-acetyltransferase [Brachybacterium hainanense]|uniref:GNAT family N-acetyltransferase n=1 Tax=Brachybacterium hainanense TaxID=1541174 RepID=A0ABV6R600_9MICO
MPVPIRVRRGPDLAPAQLYALLRLRTDVFVVEQECPYPELDGQDLLPGTVHLWIEDGAEGGAPRRVLATIRILGADGARPVIGRVATAADARGRGLAARLLEHGIGRCDAGSPIGLHAQAHLEGWYRRFGFLRDGDPYLEDGIPHVPMLRPRAAVEEA